MKVTDVMDRMPPVGWYPDGPETTLLRWWDGTAWTDHVQDPASEPVFSMVDALQVDGGAEPVTAFDLSIVPDDTRERIARGYATHPEAMRSGVSGVGISRKNPIGPSRWWDTAQQPVPSRSSTGSAWALAFTPWITTLASVGAALVYTVISPQIGTIIAGALVPLLWMLATAVQDRKSLVELGFESPASAWWILLGPLAYMIARTIRVVKVRKEGRAPLVLLLVNTVVVPIAVLAAVQFLPEIMGTF